MRRRDLLALWGGAMAAFPTCLVAQQRNRIGYLAVPPKDSEPIRVFFKELMRLGYIEGQNLDVLFYSIEEESQALAERVNELVSARVQVIVVEGAEPTLRAVRAAANGIPIVVLAVAFDPIQRGYAENLSHPGGTVTGIYFQSLELAAKQVELLKIMVPDAVRLTILWGEENPDEFAAAENSAKSYGLAINSVKLGDPPYDLAEIFRRLTNNSSQIVLMLTPPGFGALHTYVGELALRYRLPAMFRFREFVEAGGLISFGVDRVVMRRRIAVYVAKLLGGAKPADLPIEQADVFDLTLNLKTANALGITIPPLLLTQADEIIE
jgi:putative ABC transport system substrate-binding protein